ncbi:MAG: hypothetical protein ACRCVL_06800 [Cetobacterium sp.]
MKINYQKYYIRILLYVSKNMKKKEKMERLNKKKNMVLFFHRARRLKIFTA